MKKQNHKQLFYLIIFSLSLIIIEFSNFNDWLIISLLIQSIWILTTSNEIIANENISLQNKKLIKKVNKWIVRLIIFDFIIMFLSVSFAFRLLLAHLYNPIMYLTLIAIIISVILSYYIIISFLNQYVLSKRKKIVYVLTMFIYPIGQLTINKMKNN